MSEQRDATRLVSTVHRLILDGLVRHLDQQARAVEVVAAQTEALVAAVSPADGLDEHLSLAEDAGSGRPGETHAALVDASRRLQARQGELSDWLRRVSAEARDREAQIKAERAELLRQTRAMQRKSSRPTTELSTARAAEPQALAQGTLGSPENKGDMGDMEQQQQPATTHGAGEAAASAVEGEAGSERSVELDGGSSSGAVAASGASTGTGAKAGVGPATRAVRLNVGGQIYCTTLETLTSQESMLSLMFSGRFEPALSDEQGGVLIDRDGTFFRHVLNYLRSGDVFLGKDEEAHRALLAEAEFYRLEGLCELLKTRLRALEDRGERLRRLSIDTAIADTRGAFDALLREVYAEVETKAAQGKRVVSVAFLQEKRVGGAVFRSQEDGHWDKKVLDAQFHRLLSNFTTQQLLCNRLTEDGLKPIIRPLSVNTDAGRQWVSTTTFVLSLTIWEPSSPVGGRPSLSRAPLESSSPVNNTPELLNDPPLPSSYIGSLSRYIS